VKISHLTLASILVFQWFSFCQSLDIGDKPASLWRVYRCYLQAKKNECAKLKLSGKKEFDREIFLPTHILKQLFQRY